MDPFPLLAHARRLAIISAAAVLSGCGGGERAPAPEPEPERLLQSAGANPERRAETIRSFWGQVVAGEAPAEPLRSALKDLFWDRQQPSLVRLAIADAFLQDTDAQRLQDARRMLRLALPSEIDPDVRKRIADAAAERSWTDFQPALVRVLAGAGSGEVETRPEAEALRGLFPDRSLADHAWAVFRDPPEGGGELLDIAARSRSDAWDLLVALEAEADIAARLRALERPDPAATALTACWEAFSFLPMTGQELEWLEAMHAEREAWDRAVAAAGPLTIGQRRGLALRHLSPLAWASTHREAWLRHDRTGLLRDLDGRLKGRQVFPRRASPAYPDRPNAERLEDWAERLSWGDVLALLALDEALQSDEVWAVVFPQALEDRADTQSEHGGLVVFADGTGRAVAYRPRRGERLGDYRFVAPPQMLRDGAWAAAHYHLHARERFGARAAGPSRADIHFAALSGRTCVVFTTLSDSRMNADAYLPNGAVIDLGEFRTP